MNLYKRFVVPTIGTNRVQLLFSTDSGRQLEMCVSNLQYNVVNDKGDRKMIVNLSTSGENTASIRHISYIYSGSLPRDYIHREGEMEITLYNKDLVVMRERYTYKYESVLSVGTEMIINFMDETSLYASSVTPSLCRLRMLVLPLR